MNPSNLGPRTSMRAYLSTGLFTLLGLAVAALLLGRTDWFARHCDYTALQGVGYGERVGRPGCEVLIYGDSTAAAGLDPSVIERITGLKTCNISEWTSVEVVVGTGPPLDSYLKRNAPPRVLLTTWAPKYFRPMQRPLLEYHIEGVWYAWRFGMWRKLLGVRFLAWTARFVAWDLNSLVKATWLHWFDNWTVSYDPLQVRQERNGQWPFPRPAQQTCVLPPIIPAAERWEESATSFRRRYATAVTQVIVDVSPIPDCDPHFERYRRLLNGLSDNELQRWPVRYFNDLDAHLGPEGSKLLSEEAGQQVLKMLHQQDRAEPAIHGSK